MFNRTFYRFLYSFLAVVGGTMAILFIVATIVGD